MEGIDKLNNMPYQELMLMMTSTPKLIVMVYDIMGETDILAEERSAFLFGIMIDILSSRGIDLPDEVM